MYHILHPALQLPEAAATVHIEFLKPNHRRADISGGVEGGQVPSIDNVMEGGQVPSVDNVI